MPDALARALAALSAECPLRLAPACHAGAYLHFRAPYGGRARCFARPSEVPEGWLPTEAQRELMCLLAIDRPVPKGGEGDEGRRTT